MDTNWYDLLCGDDAALANKMLAYLDGKQHEQMVALLNDPAKGRRKWQERGIVPRSRNITKMIVEKSGLLFADNPPLVELYQNGEVNEQASEQLQQLLEKSDWVEHFQNVDQVVRLLKTALVLVQVNPLTGALIIDVLHRGNSNVLINPITRQIEALVYRTSYEGAKRETIRVWTNETITDYEIEPNTKQEIVINQQTNTYGIIPAAVYHDTQQPRYSFWNVPGRDLLEINEMYNLHITDSEYAASWSKIKTLFTNANIEGGDDIMEVVQPYGSKLPRQASGAPTLVGGPGTVIQVSTNTNEPPYVEYKGPDVDLGPIDAMFKGWIRDYAADWSVNVREGKGTATSGFQLVVEEIDNLQLRKQRQKMMTAGFRRLWQVMQVILNVSGDYELYLTFSDPVLPVDTKLQEEVWTMKIESGRASIIDYLMATQQLTHEQAEQHVVQILEDQKFYQQQQQLINTERSEEIISVDTEDID